MAASGRSPDAFILVLSVTFPTLLVASGTVVEERRMGTLQRVARSPASLAAFIVSKTLAAAALLALQVVVILASTRALIPTAADAVGAELAIVLLLAGLAAHALGLVLSALAGTDAQASQLTALSLLLMLTLSGFLQSLDDVPHVGPVARWFPVALGYSAVQHVLEQTAGRGEVVALPTVMLALLLAAAIVTWARTRFARRS